MTMSKRRLASSAKIVTRAGLDLVGVLLLDDQAAVELGAPEVAERLVLDHDDALVEARARRRHPPQAPAERLLGEDLVRCA